MTRMANKKRNANWRTVNTYKKNVVYDLNMVGIDCSVFFAQGQNGDIFLSRNLNFSDIKCPSRIQQN